MTAHDHSHTGAIRYEYSRKAALIGGLTNFSLSVIKISVGWLGHSQSLIADGLHSFSDLLSDALVYFAAKHAKEDPDEEHPYGHGRYETVATLALGVILALVGFEIIWDAANRLFQPENLLKPEQYTLYAAAFSIIANEGLYFYTKHLGHKIKSNLLIANAWHHRTDSVSSIVVLVGILGTLAGLPYLDAIAAVVVGVMIIHIAYELGWGAVQELADASLEKEQVEQINGIINAVAGVANVHMLRTRRMGGQASADVHIQVDPHLSVSEGHRIAEVVQFELIDQVDLISDVTVHVDPEDDESGPSSCADLPLRLEIERLFNKRCGQLPCFEDKQRLVLHYLAGQIDIEIMVPMRCWQSEAHDRELKTVYKDALADQPYIRRVQFIYYGAP